MISAFFPDVGHGLAAGIWTLTGEVIEIDCGSTDRSDDAYETGLRRIEPDLFVLSHFHVDHYNGLFEAANNTQSIRRVLYPRIPEFRERREFLRDLVAMAHRVMGGMTGSMAADFLHVLGKINRGKFEHRALAKGDTIKVGSSQLEVLWPPRTIDSTSRKAVQRAIAKYDEALEKDRTLRRITSQIGERGELYPSDESEGWLESPTFEDRVWADDSQLFPDRGEDLPASTVEANDALRKAANRLSLAFHQDNRLLFMGDLETREIGNVVGNLVAEGRTNFVVTINPHHGTHWNDELRKLDGWWSISSVGGQYVQMVEPDFKSVFDNHWVTYLNGTLSLPLYRRWRDPNVRGRWQPTI